MTTRSRVIGSLVLVSIITTGVVVIACGGEIESSAPLIGTSPDAGDRNSDSPTTNPTPDPSATATTFCDTTIGKLVGTYGKCCSAQDRDLSEYKDTIDDIATTMATCAPQLESGLASGRLAYDASAAATCYAAYPKYIDLHPCGFPSGISNDERPAPPSELASCSKVFTGLVAVDGACHGDHECVIGLTCVGWTTKKDGVCKQPPAIGATCGEALEADGTISKNLRFVYGDPHPRCAAGAWCAGTCKALAKPNGDCWQDDECPSDLKCRRRVCSSEPLSDLSGPCKSTRDCKSGLYCDQPSIDASGTCQTKKLANEACSARVWCKGRCQLADDGGTDGTCKAFCGSE